MRKKETIKWAVVPRVGGGLCWAQVPHHTLRVCLLFERRKDARGYIEMNGAKKTHRVMPVWVEVPVIGGLKN